jgi:8-oxo-dGTP pyrophosphatase MutT (NUDIX family)
MNSGEIAGLYDFSQMIAARRAKEEATRYIPRTAVVLNIVDSYGQAFIPLCAKRPKDSENFSSEVSLAERDISIITPRNWEWPGGKIDNGVVGEGAKRRFTDLPKLTVMQAALREVGEEVHVTNNRLHYLEEMPWQWQMGSERIVDNEKNVYIKNSAFRGIAWVDNVEPIPPTDEHFGGILINAVDFRDNSIRDRTDVREQIQCLSAQLQAQKLYVRRTSIRQDVFDFVTTHRERSLIDKLLEEKKPLPDQFLVLDLNESSTLVGRQYFWGLFNQNYLL